MHFLSYFFTLPRWFKQLIQLSVDAIIIALAFPLAMFIRLESFGFIRHFEYAPLIGIIVVITLLIFLLLRLYKTIVRYMSGYAYGLIFLGAILKVL